MEKRGEDRKGQERRGIVTEEEQSEGKVMGKRFGKGEGGGEEAGARFPFPTFTTTSPATSAASLLRVERSPLPVGELILQSAL